MKVGKPFLGFLISFNPGYTQFLRSLLLKPKGSKVKLYTGGNAHFQTMNYAVVDNRPVRDIHLIRNLENPFRSPWFNSDGSEKRFLLSITPFKVTDLRHY